MKITYQLYLEKGYLNHNPQTNDRDGVMKNKSGQDVSIDDNRESILYSKFDALDSILEVYNELKIISLVSRISQLETIDYSKLHRYLHRGIFLNNGAIYIDLMDMPRQQMHYDSSDIVAMYCYILNEIKQQLDESINPVIRGLSEKFQQKYIGYQGSLFSELYYQQVINLLKDALEVIDNYTPIKDIDYWDFYDAIETFLYGEINNSSQGFVWGFDNFHSIWESMCLTFLVKHIQKNRIIYLDNRYVASEIASKINDKNNLIIDTSNMLKLNGIQLFPDAVIISDNTKKSDSISSLAEEPIRLTINNWNDYNYYTTFTCKDQYPEQLKIAYLNQLPLGGKSDKSNYKDCHTYSELAKFFESGENFILIDSCLPDNFYSYWEITDSLDDYQIKIMQQLNHVFIMGLKKNLYTYSDFYEYFSNLGGVFIGSLFRNYYFEQRDKFFIPCWKNYKNLKIIDVKYSTFDYYLKPENQEEIKSRSIRKQFVYEYLIQNHLTNTNSNLKNLSINSEFWLPVYPQESTLKYGPEYLDDYVKLRGINIMTVIDNYIQATSSQFLNDSGDLMNSGNPKNEIYGQNSQSKKAKNITKEFS
ncbi:MAG: hypothetical protein SWX82_06025 [Cyanobacteriota bacterium]|nr:hypothetical protein [Cyanobacteriota bacterium]